MNKRISKRNELREYFGNVLNLDNSNMLSKNIIKEYNYFDMKEKILEVQCIIDTFQCIYINQNLGIDFNPKDFKLFCNNKSINNVDNTKILSLNLSYYEKDIILAFDLVEKYISAWNRLNGVERYILCNNLLYELNDGALTDEDMIIDLGIYKDKYNHYKHSAYIKFGILLGLNEELLDFNGILFE